MNCANKYKRRARWTKAIAVVALAVTGSLTAVAGPASEECDMFCRVMNTRLQLWGSDAGSALICDERELAENLEAAAMDYFSRQLDSSNMPAVEQRFGELVHYEWQFQKGIKPNARYCKVVVTAARSSLRHIAELIRRGE